MSASPATAPNPGDEVHRKDPRVIVVGCGAMGGTFAGALASSGADVTVIEHSETIRHSIAAHGLVVVHSDGTESSHVLKAFADASELDPPDFVFFFVKAVHNRSAASECARLIGPETIVVTVQNGMGHGEVFSNIVAADRLVVGVTTEGANMLEPGRVSHYARGTTMLGPWERGAALESSETAAALISRSGLDCRATDETLDAIWGKLVFNSAYSSVAALTGLSIKGLGSEPHVWALCEAVVRESAEVARRSGATVNPESVVARANQLYDSVKDGAIVAGKASMLLDVEARRPTEVDALNGAIMLAGLSAGVATPLNDTLFALVKGLEHSWLPDAN